MSWTVTFKLVGHDFDVSRDPVGGFNTKLEACDEVVAELEERRRDLARAIRKAKQMRRRAKA